MAQITDVEAISDKELLIIPARPGSQPVTNIDAFLASLPDFEPEEIEAFEQAIAENQAERRAIEATHDEKHL